MSKDKNKNEAKRIRDDVMREANKANDQVSEEVSDSIMDKLAPEHLDTIQEELDNQGS